MLATVSLALLEPVGQLVADLRDRRASLLERAPDALAVVPGRSFALLAQRRLLAALHVVTADDPVVVPLAHPAEQLVNALDRQRVGDLEVLEHAREAVEALALRVVQALLEERVEV